MTDYSEQNTQQPYNHAGEQPTTARPVVEIQNPYASLRGDSSNKQLPTFDQALIHKYNRSGPRYTSYPTALEFTEIADGLETKILQSREARAPLSLYFHIPFCRHLCYYCACNKIITKKNSDSGDYLAYLIDEVKQKRRLLTAPEGSDKPIVKQLHLGGGTPTFLRDEELVQLWKFLQTQFEFLDEDKGDYSIEIDPRELGDNTLKTLRRLGFNRISLGVQDLDDAVQIAVNRVHSAELIAHILAEARKLGFGSINIDLIYGLPHQTPDTLDKTVARIIEMSPDRLSVFNYAHLPERFKAQRQIKDEDLPSPSDKLTMLGNTVNMLTTAGYQYIGIDHFAKADDELAIAQRAGKLHRNFQGYTIMGDCDLLGFGVSAISQIANANTRYILQNHTDLTVYQETINAARSNPNVMPAAKVIKTSIKDRLREYVIMNLLCHDYIDFKDVNQKFGIDAVTYFIDEISQLDAMQKDKLIDMDAAGIRVLPRGRLLGRNVAMVFDEYLSVKHKDRFSKVI
ncbi:oxygen-independent coproporphyrinogen III oxidase [Psychrobacter submarinus]|uniref:oxygen-independent coproporphyrinogen III oxidase n=1 Tax=Psychrobacter submarinus TaxID=154108 RepID=UPI001918858C|nr:oxygen-independent coproporphyrinogen III oxidase [Psychrobacter submarinus]